MERMSRREFLKAGAGAIALSAVLRDPFALFGAPRKRRWVAPDEGRIGFVSGEVLVNESRADAGSRVGPGDVVRTGRDSEAEIELMDHSVFRMRELSVVQVSELFESPRIEVRKGWLLLIVRKGTPALLTTPTVLAGVRGTVLFVNVLSDDRAYLCNCRGKIDLFDPLSRDMVRTVTSGYHTAFHVGRSDGTVSLEKAGLLYHTDDDILAMGRRFIRETQVFRNRKSSGSPRGGGY